MHSITWDHDTKTFGGRMVGLTREKEGTDIKNKKKKKTVASGLGREGERQENW